LAGPSPHRGGIQPGSPQSDRGRASAATCEFNVYWRAVEADLRERDDPDLVEPVYLQIGDDGWLQIEPCIWMSPSLE
jgi:hypothetical protein